MYICDAVTVKGPSRKPFPKFIPRVLWRKGTHWQEPIVTDNFLTVALSVQALCCIKARGGGGEGVSKEICGTVRLPVWRHVSRQ